jgi:hypothetical protein
MVSKTRTHNKFSLSVRMNRSAPRPAPSLALRAAGVALPPTVRQLADA